MYISVYMTLNVVKLMCIAFLKFHVCYHDGILIFLYINMYIRVLYDI